MSRRVQTGLPPRPATSYPHAERDVPTITFQDSEPEAGEEPLAEPLLLGGLPVPAPVLAPPPVTETDGYLDRLLKYIPTEIIALYLGAINIVPHDDPAYWPALWTIAALSTLCTPVYMYFATREPDKPTLWSQILISSIAFPIWVFAMGGPFRQFSWYSHRQWISAIIISFCTFGMGLFRPAAPPRSERRLAQHRKAKAAVTLSTRRR